MFWYTVGEIWETASVPQNALKRRWDLQEIIQMVETIYMFL